MNTEYNLPNQRTQSRYFSPHSFKMFTEKLPENSVKSSFSIFHSIVSIHRNLEKVELLFDELDFHLDVIGISETTITNSNESNAHPSIQGYVFEHTAISRKVVGRNVHATIPKGNMGYDQYTVPDTVAVEPTFAAFF